MAQRRALPGVWLLLLSPYQRLLRNLFRQPSLGETQISTRFRPRCLDLRLRMGHSFLLPPSSRVQMTQIHR